MKAKTQQNLLARLAVVLIKHVSAYCEVNIRFTVLGTGDY